MFQLSEIDALPTGLIVRHLPAQVQAVPVAGHDGTAFRWEYRTGVSAMTDATVIGFAAFRWDGATWVPRDPDGAFFTAGDFSQWYETVDAKVGAGQDCADSTNFCTRATLSAERVKWVFVADCNGRRVKGEAVVELLGELEPHAADLDDPLEQLRANAELFRKTTMQHTGRVLEYDEAAVRWLDGYVIRNRATLKGNPGALDTAGSFFGECLVRIFGGQWIGGAEGESWGVRIDERLVVFPFAKLHKHIVDEHDGGDSLIGMFKTIGPMMAVNAHKVKHFRQVDGKMVPVDPPPPPPPPPEPPAGDAAWKFWKKT